MLAEIINDFHTAEYFIRDKQQWRDAINATFICLSCFSVKLKVIFFCQQQFKPEVYMSIYFLQQSILADNFICTYTLYVTNAVKTYNLLVGLMPFTK